MFQTSTQHLTFLVHYLVPGKQQFTQIWKTGFDWSASTNGSCPSFQQTLEGQERVTHPSEHLRGRLGRGGKLTTKVYELYNTTVTDFKRVSVNLTSLKWHVGEGVMEMPTRI